MNHPLLVRVLDGPSQRADQRRGLPRRQRTGLCHSVGERRPVHELHDEVRLPVAGADFVDGDDVRVLQVGRRRRLRLEPGTVRVRREVRFADHLHSDDPAE